MANFDTQYQQLVKILINKADELKRLSPNRTGIPSVKIPGYEIRIRPEDGFPLLGLKSTPFKLIAQENFWFLRGDTSNNSLLAVGAFFWDKWALRLKDMVLYLAAKYPEKFGTALGDFKRIVDELYNDDTEEKERFYDLILEQDKDSLTFDTLGFRIKRPFMLKLIEMAGQDGWQKALYEPVEVSPGVIEKPINTSVINVDERGTHAYVTRRDATGDISFIHEGDLGPIYGKQWRNFNGVDQIADLVKTLKTNPMSRRMVTSAWNPAVLPDESISPQFNVIEGRAALASCHYAFTCVCEELTRSERSKEFAKSVIDNGYSIEDASLMMPMGDESFHLHCDHLEIPKYKLNLIFNMRSSDVGLGLPFNMVGYALLQRMLASHCNMVIGDVVYKGEDVHLYSNQIEPMRAILELTPTTEPVVLEIEKKVESFDADTAYNINNFVIHNYKPQIKVVMDAAV